MKQKLIYLFSLMLICILGTSGALAETVTATWDFTGSTPTPATLANVNVQSRATFYPSDNDVAALYVDALSGKLAYNNGNAQFNSGTILRVPVYTTDDVVTITSYPNYYNYTVGGTAASANETVHTATSSEVSQGYVEIVATADAYLYSITLETTATTAKNAAWNFYNEIPSTINGVSIDNTTGTVASSVSSVSLDVDASSSKFQARGTDAWFTAGTILKVPVANKGDIVTIMAYSTSYDNYTVGGTDASNSDTPIFTYKATSTDATNRYVSIVATDQSYIYAIAVQQIPAKEAVNYTWTFDDYEGVSDLSDSGSVTLSQTSDPVEVSSSNSVALNYIAGTATASKIIKNAAATVGDGSYTSNLYMGGGGSTSARYFTTGTITGKGKLTVVYAGTVGGTCSIYDASNTSSALATITPSASSPITSATIDCGTSGKSLLITHSSKCAIYAIIWTESTESKEESTFALTSESSVQLSVGETSQITYENNAGTVTYESGSNSIATVSDAGLITAVTGGSTKITVSDPGSDTVEEGSATVNVIIPYDLVAATTYTINSTTYGFSDSSNTYYFTNGFTMSNNNSKVWATSTAFTGAVKYSANVTYTINIPDGVTVSSATVKGRSNASGTTYWGDLFGEDYSSVALPGMSDDAEEKTVTFTEGATGSISFTPKGGQVLFSIVLNTDPREDSDLALTSDASVQIDEIGETANVTWSTSADNSNVTIASNNTSVATVEKTGEGTATITAVAEGTCTITITQEGDEDYKDDTKTITVTVGNPATVINYAIDFTKSWAADLNTSGAASQCWVTSISNGVPTYETSAPSDYLMYFKGYYKNSTYGIYYGAQFQIPVTAGSYKITLGCSDYGGNVPVTDGTNTLTSINNSGGKYAQSSSNISYGYVTVDEACTLYLTAPNNNVYFPYFAIETVDEVPSAYTVTFMNGETEVSSSTIYEGTSIGSLPSDPNTDSSKQFIGWYTALDGTGEFATTATVPTADITYYANILDVTTNNGYVVVDNSGNDGRNGESFKAAIAWANANSGYDVFVPNGTYDLGDQISASITGVTITRQMAIVGESTDGVLVKAETEAENESINTAAIKINGGLTGVYLQNLTIQNYPKAYNTSTNAERALALWDRGTQTVLKNGLQIVELQFPI